MNDETTMKQRSNLRNDKVQVSLVTMTMKQRSKRTRNEAFRKCKFWLFWKNHVLHLMSTSFSQKVFSWPFSEFDTHGKINTTPYFIKINTPRVLKFLHNPGCEILHFLMRNSVMWVLIQMKILNFVGKTLKEGSYSSIVQGCHPIPSQTSTLSPFAQDEEIMVGSMSLKTFQIK